MSSNIYYYYTKRERSDADQQACKNANEKKTKISERKTKLKSGSGTFDCFKPVLFDADYSSPI